MNNTNSFNFSFTGGYCGISDVAHCECLDTVTGEWHEIAKMNKPRMYHAACASQNRIYALGGRNSMGMLESIEKYNPELNMWLVIKTKFFLRLGTSASLGFKQESESDMVMIVGGVDSSLDEHNDVITLSLKSPGYEVDTGKPMLEKRAYCGVTIL